MGLAGGGVAVWLLLTSTPASAQEHYWRKSVLLEDMFPAAMAVEPVRYKLSAEERAAFRERLGYRCRGKYIFYEASTADGVVGYAFFDSEKGKYEPIAYAVQLDVDGVVLRQEVVSYGEARGAEVAEERFRRQFVGKRVSDPLALGVDVDGVSGATFSSGAMAVGVKRALVLFEMWRRVSAAAPASTAPVVPPPR